MSLLIQTAHAAGEAAPAGQGGPLQMLIFFLGFIAIFYFMIWRPQSKRNKEHRSMIDSIKEGNEVVFAGGLVGTVKKLDGDYAVISLAERNEVVVQKAAVISVLPQGTISGIKG